ncbi:MAG TPA: hypothetical protein VE912_05280 [Bacteroidales bacterium]|nr:hypothetical protein [Bacteroidales bacterium]
MKTSAAETMLNTTTTSSRAKEKPSTKKTEIINPVSGLIRRINEIPGKAWISRKKGKQVIKKKTKPANREYLNPDFLMRDAMLE